MGDRTNAADRIEALEADNARLRDAQEKLEMEAWGDRKDDLTEACKADHPHKKRENWPNYVRAIELVTNRHSKYALVDLVNHLLCEIDRAALTENTGGNNGS